MIDGVVHVAAVPEGQDVCDQAEGAELLLRAGAVSVVDVAPTRQMSPVLADQPNTGPTPPMAWIAR